MGDMADWLQEQDIDGDDGPEPCRTCEGTGEFANRPCGDCAGTGVEGEEGEER